MYVPPYALPCLPYIGKNGYSFRNIAVVPIPMKVWTEADGEVLKHPPVHHTTKLTGDDLALQVSS